jgi:hypothetical protein
MQLALGGWQDGLRLVGTQDDTPDLTGKVVQNSDMINIPYADIVAACGGKPYPMTLNPEEAAWVIAAVNIGIDSHLEACNVPSRGDSYRWGSRPFGTTHWVRRLVCKVSPQSLPTLLRRLTELDVEWDDASGGPECLVDTILQTLGFDEFGKFVGREES